MRKQMAERDQSRLMAQEIAQQAQDLGFNLPQEDRDFRQREAPKNEF